MAVETAIPRSTSGGPREAPQLSTAVSAMDRIEIDGKQFMAGDRRFQFRGVTYGTFARRADGALFPESDQLVADLEASSTAGVRCSRTDKCPRDDVTDS